MEDEASYVRELDRWSPSRQMTGQAYRPGLANAFPGQALGSPLSKSGAALASPTKNHQMPRFPSPLKHQGLSPYRQQEMIKDHLSEAIARKYHHYSRSFQSVDVDRNGVITKEELSTVLRNQNLEEAAAPYILKVADKDRSGDLNFREFVQGVANAPSPSHTSLPMGYHSPTKFQGTAVSIKHHDNPNPIQWAPSPTGASKSSQSPKRGPSDNNIIEKEKKSESELNPDDKKLLAVQKKIMTVLDQRSYNSSRALLELFRECKPDEFGFIKKENFKKQLSEKYMVSPDDAEKLFRLSDSRGENEISYHRFRNAFQLLNEVESPSPQPVPHKRLYDPTKDKDKPSSWGDFTATPKPTIQPTINLSELTLDERNRFRDITRIEKAVMENRLLEQEFKQERSEPTGLRVHLKQPLSVISKKLETYGVQMSEQRLGELIGEDSSEITYSQLVKKTADSASLIQNPQFNHKHGQSSYHGVREGRQFGPNQHPGARLHISEPYFLAHDSQPTEVMGPIPTVKYGDGHLVDNAAGVRSDFLAMKGHLPQYQRVEKEKTSEPRGPETSPLLSYQEDERNSRWTLKTIPSPPKHGLAGPTRKHFELDKSNPDHLAVVLGQQGQRQQSHGSPSKSYSGFQSQANSVAAILNPVGSPPLPPSPPRRGPPQPLGLPPAAGCPSPGKSNDVNSRARYALQYMATPPPPFATGDS